MNAHAAVLFEFCADDANTPIHCARWVSDLTFLLSGTNFIRFFTISPWLLHVLFLFRMEPVAQNFIRNCKFSPLCKSGIMKISSQFMTLLVRLYLRMYHIKTLNAPMGFAYWLWMIQTNLTTILWLQACSKPEWAGFNKICSQSKLTSNSHHT